MTINPQRAQALFLAALEISDAEARRELLEHECANDAAVRQRVEDLLAAHDAVGGFDAAPSNPAINATMNAPADPQPGSLVAGRYKLLEKVGEGGMGSVWVAEQSVPVKRKVALKLIKAGMDSKAVLARFDAERQALALMDHPNIAKVLDAGTTESGRPYFVMELVKGTPITEFCDARKLSPRQRLELFVPVCQAIQHAHQKGIIHRDIKPSNVLVAMYDDRSVPKVIDFGVAKATGQSLTDQSMYTGFGAVVGTPEYMSPEQASINNLDIDTRSDVYSLGVLLYELLTGTTPVDRKSLGKAAVLEILRVVREVEAPRPSAKLSRSDTLPSVAANRGSEPAKLSKLMRGELDWVLLKALEKDRSRRYDTANGLARDIQRYLDDEVVEARPPSAGYRLQKIVRRHKGQMIAASLLLFALLAGIAGTTVGLFEAKRQEQKALVAAEEERKAKLEAEAEKANALKAAEAEKLAKLDADAKRQDAELNLAFAKKGNEILGSVFAGLDPKKIAESGRPLQDLLRENLVKAVKELDGSAIGDPLEVAAMQNTLGVSLLSLGEYGLAIEVFAKAMETWKAKLGPEHPNTLISMNNLALAYDKAGNPDLALRLFEETLKLEKAKSPILSNLSNWLPFRLPFPTDQPNTLASIMGNLAGAYKKAGKLDLAISLCEETLELCKAKLGPEHSQTLVSMNNLASAYLAAGKRDLALPLHAETLKLTKDKLGSAHPQTLTSMNNLASCYWLLKQLDKSVPLFEELLPIQVKKLGRDHPNTQRAVGNLGANYKDAGRLTEAIPLLEEAYQASKKFPTLKGFGPQLLDAYKKAGETAKFTALLKEQLADARETLPSGSPELAGHLTTYGRLMLGIGEFADAEPILRECLAIREKTQPDAWSTFNTQALLGGALLGQRKYAEAEPLLLKGYEGMQAREETIPPQGSTRIPEALERLIELYTNWHASEPDKGYDAKAAEWQTKQNDFKDAANAEPSLPTGTVK